MSEYYLQKRALKILKKYKNKVYPELDKLIRSPTFPSQFRISSRFEKIEKFHWKIVGNYPKRMGKYIRPSLLMLTTSAFGGNLESALKTAVAMQLSEEWLLIHDDIMDGSLLRRGKPTLNRVYGLEMALNAGDVLQTLMWRALFDNFKILSREKANEIVKEFFLMLVRTEIGQTAEVYWRGNLSLDFSEDDWNFLVDAKTGYYTCAGPLRLGAIIAGCKPSYLNILTEFGLKLGRAFQLVDDILDLTSDFSGLKKRFGDLYEGKLTLIFVHLLKNAQKKERLRIAEIYSKKINRKAKDVREIFYLIKKYNSIEFAKKTLEKYKNEIEDFWQKKLVFLPDRSEKSELKTIINFILEREF